MLSFSITESSISIKSGSLMPGYSKIPDLNDKIVILVDPMLATGSTIKYLLSSIRELKPKKVFLLVAIASNFAINLLEENFPYIDIYTAGIDAELNDKGYIIPGLGDAGDRVCNTSH